MVEGGTIGEGSSPFSLVMVPLRCVSYWSLMIAAITLFYGTHIWRYTVVHDWAIPPHLLTIPGAPSPVAYDAAEGDAIRDELSKTLRDISDTASEKGAEELRAANGIAESLHKLYSAFGVRVENGNIIKEQQAATTTTAAPGSPSSPRFPFSVAHLFVRRKQRPTYQPDSSRPHSGADISDTYRMLGNALDATLFRKADVLQNVTFAINTVDKLKYQLDNFAPLRHKLATPQWNPKRLSDVAPKRRKYFMIGLCSVSRSTDYVVQTIRSLFSAMNQDERRGVKIVLFNADLPPSKHHAMNALRVEFIREINDGSLVIMAGENSAHTYPELSPDAKRPLTVRWGDSMERVKWRAKQVLDVAFLMEQCYRRPERFEYFLMLEDDIIASKNFPTKIRSYVDGELFSKTDWTMVSFYNPWDDVKNGDYLPPYKYKGVIGQLFRMHDLPVLVEFLKLNFDQSPLDWLIVDFLKKIDGRLVQHSPSFFQHQGVVSSFPNKQQPEKAVDFDTG